MKRIDGYLIINNLYDPMHSAYKINRSTETAIGKLHNDIIQSLAQGDCTVLAYVQWNWLENVLVNSTKFPISYVASVVEKWLP